MEPNDKVIANIIADSQETADCRDRLNRRQFLTQLAAGVGGIGGALSTLPAFAQLSSGQLQPDATTETVSLTPVVEAIGKKVWENDQLNEDAVSELMDQAMMKLTGRSSAKEAWRDIVLPDDIVGIKINPLAGPELSTHSIIVDKIVEGLYGAGVLRKQIIIWDRFEEHLLNAGYPIKQDEADVRTFASDTEGIGYDDEVFYESEKDSAARRENESTRSRYSRIVTQQVDVLINVPVLKHHAMAGVSGCLKNLAFGSVDNTRRFHGKPIYCNPAIAEILEHKVLKEKLVLNIVDGLVASFDRGPVYHAESAWNYGGLFISADPVILDVLVLQTVNQKREEMELDSVSKLANHISSASKLDLGTNTLDQADLRQVEV
ncbi:DUF362 domain-containing protein [Candidatus Poribacteria bacterium]|nr:DUF362 domain-containing protein [Candidatus Poribacteria bacterium]MYG09164.1 DUF362 domain-containing protein [Candidatus Poribacteria bacterium]MYK20703.1 DUF362 domain-containing protein [Candidatus Poribacteria bacterium]